MQVRKTELFLCYGAQAPIPHWPGGEAHWEGVSTPQERDARAQGILERDIEEVLYIPELICMDLKANSVQSFSPL